MPVTAAASLSIFTVTTLLPLLIAELAAKEFPRISVCVSRRLRRGWRFQWERRDSSIGTLTIPLIFELAPTEIQWQLLRWAQILLQYKRRMPAEMNEEKKRLQQSLENFISSPMLRQDLGDSFGGISYMECVMEQNRRRIGQLSPEGRIHDLTCVFNWVNDSFFAGRLHARLTWSKRTGRQSTHCRESDEKGVAYDLITISRVYDFENVSREVLGGVIFHECLHITCPPYMKNDRRKVHYPEFRKQEKTYPYYDDWIRWQKSCLSVNIRKLRRNGKKWNWRGLLLPRING